MPTEKSRRRTTKSIVRWEGSKIKIKIKIKNANKEE
jgi:hypothetical protein